LLWLLLAGRRVKGKANSYVEVQRMFVESLRNETYVRSSSIRVLRSVEKNSVKQAGRRCSLSDDHLLLIGIGQYDIKPFFLCVRVSYEYECFLYERDENERKIFRLVNSYSLHNLGKDTGKSGVLYHTKERRNSLRFRFE